MYQSRPGGLFKHIDFMILDLFCIWLVLWIAHFLRVGSMNMLRSYAYRSLFVIIALVHICVALFTASYKDILRRSRLREFAAVCEHVASVMVVTLMFLFFIKVTDDLSRMVMVSLIVFSVGALWCERLLWKKVVHHRLRTNPRLLLLVADRAGAKRIIARVQRSLDISVEGIVLTGGKNSGSIQGVPIVAEADGMEDYLRNHAIDEVIFSAHQDKPLQDSMIRKCRLMGLTIHTEMEISNEMPEVRYEENIAGITVMTG